MPTIRLVHPRYRALALFAALVVAAACSDSPTSSADDRSLEGLVTLSLDDSVNGPPDDTVPDGPGHFKGVVRGWDPSVSDTMASLVPLPNVRVTAYERDGTVQQPELGDPVAQTFSNQQGHWELPTVPGGEYIITFVPAASSGYRSGWTLGFAWPGSGNNTWGISLPKASN